MSTKKDKLLYSVSEWVEEALEEGKWKPNPPEQDGVPDMCHLQYLEGPHIVHNIERRYKKKSIYSNVTNILIAINPYQTLSIYTQNHSRLYTSAERNKLKDQEPHIYRTGETAYRDMLLTSRNQALIVCGESGSGKTESAKHLMRHLAYTTQVDVAKGNLRENTSMMIEQQVLAANPILENFGNAKTKLNNNSSRFGKFTKVLFSSVDSGAQIVGSFVETYLLEKSRVVQQEKGERNFHVFYSLILGLPSEEKEALRLTKCEDYHYLNQSGCIEIDGVSDKARLMEVQSAMDTLQFSRREQSLIFRVLSSILHLGNVEFEDDDSKSDASCVTPPSRKSLMYASQLLGVPTHDLHKTVINKKMVVAKQDISKPLTPSDATLKRDAMTKVLYTRLFSWIVKRVNETLYSASSEEDGDSLARYVWIGILDVFGFENFENNSFEQFCINHANEHLQQLFNERVILSEQGEYLREGIEWKSVKLPEINPVIELFESKPNGILAMLDSACLMRNTSHEVFTSNLFNAHRKSPVVKQVLSIKVPGSRQRTHINGFSVSHYASNVVYRAEAFLQKNSDNIDSDISELFIASENTLVAMLLDESSSSSSSSSKGGSKPSPSPSPSGSGSGPVSARGRGRSGGKNKLKSVGSAFSQQLNFLISQLKQTQSHFIRCINPNDIKQPNALNAEYVCRQLRCGGLIEAVRILKLGFPSRVSYSSIFNRYGHVLKQLGLVDVNERDFCESVLFAFDVDRTEYRLGLTKVFFKPNKQEIVNEILADTIPNEVMTRIKKNLFRKKRLRIIGVLKSTGVLSVLLRRIRSRAKLRNAVGALMVISKALVEPVQNLRFAASTLTIQAALRSYLAKRECTAIVRRVRASRMLWSWYCHRKWKRAYRGIVEKKKREEEEKKKKKREKEIKGAALKSKKDNKKDKKRGSRERDEETGEDNGKRNTRATDNNPKHKRSASSSSTSSASGRGRYVPSPPSIPYDIALSPIVTQVAEWICKVLGYDMHLDLFDELRNGVLLCDLACKLSLSPSLSPTSNNEAMQGKTGHADLTPNRYAIEGSFFARHNLIKFLKFCYDFGVSEEQLFREDALGVKGEKAVGGIYRSVLSLLLNIVYITHMYPAAAPAIDAQNHVEVSEEQEEESKCDKEKERENGKHSSPVVVSLPPILTKMVASSRSGIRKGKPYSGEVDIVFFTSDGGLVYDPFTGQRMNSFEDDYGRHNASTEVTSKHTDDSSSSNHHLNANLLPQPTISTIPGVPSRTGTSSSTGGDMSSGKRVGDRARRISVTMAKSQDEGFFCMTVATVLRKLEESGRIKSQEWDEFNPTELYGRALIAEVEWHDWNDWVPVAVEEYAKEKGYFYMSEREMRKIQKRKKKGLAIATTAVVVGGAAVASGVLVAEKREKEAEEEGEEEEEDEVEDIENEDDEFGDDSLSSEPDTPPPPLVSLEQMVPRINLSGVKRVEEKKGGEEDGTGTGKREKSKVPALALGAAVVGAGVAVGTTSTSRSGTSSTASSKSRRRRRRTSSKRHSDSENENEEDLPDHVNKYPPGQKRAILNREKMYGYEKGHRRDASSDSIPSTSEESASPLEKRKSWKTSWKKGTRAVKKVGSFLKNILIPNQMRATYSSDESNSDYTSDEERDSQLGDSRSESDIDLERELQEDEFPSAAAAATAAARRKKNVAENTEDDSDLGRSETSLDGMQLQAFEAVSFVLSVVCQSR